MLEVPPSSCLLAVIPLLIQTHPAQEEPLDPGLLALILIHVYFTISLHCCEYIKKNVLPSMTHSA